MRIAVVDDDPSFRKSLRRLLDAFCIEVIAFASGGEFLRQVRDLACDCFILDLHMPGMGGFEIQQRLRQMGIPVPVLMISADDDPRQRARAMEAGFAGWVRKPASADALLEAVVSALRLHGDPRPPATATAARRTPARRSGAGA